MSPRRPVSSPNRSAELQFRWASRFDGTRDVDWHAHGETELVAVTAGRCRIRVGAHRLEGARGSLFVLPAGVAQYQETLGRTCTTFAGFQAPAGIFDESARVLRLEPGDPALAWLEQLCECQTARPALSAEVSRSLLATLLRRIAEIDAAAGLQGQLHPAVHAAVTQMESNPADAHTLAALAKGAGASASHLGALFATHCQCSPMQYLQRLRLERACWLLDNPYLRIREVAAACGYADENYFVRLFRRRFGQPPGRWRAERLRQSRAS